jgi:23S rRNA (cytosine1962-C5)-methyltransferase
LDWTHPGSREDMADRTHSAFRGPPRGDEPLAKIILKEGRERSLLRRHPWVFSGAVDRVEGSPAPGETVGVFSGDGRFLGRGAYSPESQIRVRIWTFDEAEEIDAAFLAARIQAAIALREALQVPAETDAFRLVYAESDGLPGLIVDRYRAFLVCQFLSTGVERFKDAIIDRLSALAGIRGIYERSDADVRKKEGLAPRCGLRRGEEPPSLIEIEENGLRFLVDIRNGHKTGFYLDQRPNRGLVRSYSKGAEVLNCFAYTGGFGLAAMKGGAEHVTNVEDLAGLIELTEKNVLLNQFDTRRCANVRGDVFRILRQYQDLGQAYDVIVLDPPKFADAQSHLPRASRGYKDINRLAFTLLRPGGLLFTFSCSGVMKMDLFQKIVADAALDAGRDAQILQWLGQGPDHPVNLQIPETSYLKGLFLRVRA